MLLTGNINSGGGDSFWENVTDPPNIINKNRAVGGVEALDNSNPTNFKPVLSVLWNNFMGVLGDVVNQFQSGWDIRSGQSELTADNINTGDMAIIQARVDATAGDAVAFLNVQNFPTAPAPGQPIFQSAYVDADGFHVTDNIGDPDNFGIKYNGNIRTNQVANVLSNNNRILKMIEVFDVTGVSQGFIPVMVNPGTPTAAPTIAVGAGAGGAGSSVSVVGTDREGTITLTTGAVPLAASVVFVLSYGTVYSVLPNVVFSAANAAAAALGGALGSVYVTPATSKFTFSTGATPLGVGVTYSWTYVVNNL